MHTHYRRKVALRLKTAGTKFRFPQTSSHMAYLRALARSPREIEGRRKAKGARDQRAVIAPDLLMKPVAVAASPRGVRDPSLST